MMIPAPESIDTGRLDVDRAAREDVANLRC